MIQTVPSGATAAAAGPNQWLPRIAPPPRPSGCGRPARSRTGTPGCGCRRSRRRARRRRRRWRRPAARRTGRGRSPGAPGVQAPPVAVEHDDPFVAGVRDVHPARGVGRGGADVAEPVAAAAAPLADVPQAAGERDDAVVVVVDHVHPVAVNGDVERVDELAGPSRSCPPGAADGPGGPAPGRGGCPRRRRTPRRRRPRGRGDWRKPRRAAGQAPDHGAGAVEVEALDAVVGAVGDVHVPPAHRDPPAGRLVGPLAGAEVELADAAAARAPHAEQAPTGAEALDAVAGAVEHVDVPARVHREPVDRPELPGTRAVGAPLAEEAPRRGEALHDVAELVRHVQVAVGGESERLGAAQHPFPATADRADGGVRAGRAQRARAGRAGVGRRGGSLRAGRLRPAAAGEHREQDRRCRGRGVRAEWPRHPAGQAACHGPYGGRDRSNMRRSPPIGRTP